MATETNKTFTGRVVLDETTFEGCTFSNATLVYYGGDPPSFVTCSFDRCQWSFKSSAGATIAFLRQMAHAEGGFRQVFDQIFALKEPAAATASET